MTIFAGKNCPVFIKFATKAFNMKEDPAQIQQDKLSFEDFRQQVLEDYKLAHLSRQLSLTGRKEVLSGRGKFGIFGGGTAERNCLKSHGPRYSNREISARAIIATKPS